MTNEQWQRLLAVIRGEVLSSLPVGFVIDSPWLPGWAGLSTLDYYASGEKWFAANLKAIRSFPDVLFLPGFWSEFGMCTEPSAFGARCTFPANEFPHAHRVLRSIDDLGGIRTLGFRGEALPAIAAVARLVLQSREADALAGYRLEVDALANTAGAIRLSERLSLASAYRRNFRVSRLEVTGDWGIWAEDTDVPADVNEAAVECVLSWIDRPVSTITGYDAASPGDALPNMGASWDIPRSAYLKLQRYSRNGSRPAVS